jgi:hypothetical protein
LLKTDPPAAPPGLAARVLAILSYFILLSGLITIVVSAYMVVVSYSNLPYWDGWLQINYVAEGGNPFTFGWLWSQHNEHRLLIPRLFLLADLYWFHASQVFLLSSIFLIQLLHLLVLSWSMRVFGGWRGAPWRSGIGLAAFCLFHPLQWENLVWGFQVCFVLPGLFASLSFAGLVLYWRRTADAAGTSSSWTYLLLSIAAALGATWSLSNGNLLWPLLVLAALVLRRGRVAVLYAIAGALSTTLFFYNYGSSPEDVNTLAAPINIMKYLAAYLGSPWASSVRMAEVIGVAGSVALLIVSWRTPSYIRKRQFLNVFLVLLALSCLGTGWLTAFGRSRLGIGHAFTSRYQTVSLLFWCCLGLLLLGWVSSLRRMRDLAFILAQTALLAVMWLGARSADNLLRAARLHGFRLNAAAMALVTGVTDSEQLQWSFWQPDYLPSLVPYMQRERLSVFHEPYSRVLGKPLESVFHIGFPLECAGELETSVPIGGSDAEGPPRRITGWAWDYGHRRPASGIVAASNGIIVGLGAVGNWRPIDKTMHRRMTSNYSGYTGYVQGQSVRDPVEIYAILHGEPASACLIATMK